MSSDVTGYSSFQCPPYDPWGAERYDVKKGGVLVFHKTNLPCKSSVKVTVDVLVTSS